jgi:hypothetical protein
MQPAQFVGRCEPELECFGPQFHEVKHIARAAQRGGARQGQQAQGEHEG